MTAGISRRFHGIVLPLIGDSPVSPTGVGPWTMALITLPLSDLLALGMPHLLRRQVRYRLTINNAITHLTIDGAEWSEAVKVFGYHNMPSWTR